MALLLAGCTAASSPTTVVGSTTVPDQVTTPSGSGTIERTRVMVSGDQSYPEGFTIPADESWVFDPEVDTTVTVSANVVVLGELVMQPASEDVEHALIFEGVDESAFVGGGMDPLASDVGLWVMGDGQLRIDGEEKTAWGYEYDPAWEGDEVVAAPNTPGNYTDFAPVTSTPPVNELGYPTELLNLTRNVRIEGTPEGYTHVFIRSTQPQTIRYAAIRYVAPSFGETDATGRYGMHIHMSGDGSRGSMIEGVVIRDAGNHAFVPHASHGITYRDTIAYNVLNEAYWWDEPVKPDGDDRDITNDTNDLIWDRAVAAGVNLGVPGNRFRLAGFYLGNGENVTITNSVAVAVQGESGADRSGFIWPESSEAVWLFEDNIAHNNKANGIFVWQNNADRHDVERFTAYYNDGAGVDHGAYENSYQYTDLTLLENGLGVISHAFGDESEGTDTQVWSNIVTGGATLYIDEHATESEVPVRFVNCDFGQVVVADAGGEPSEYDFVDCGLEPDQFDLSQAIPDGVFRVQRADGTAYELRGNGTVSEIPAFYD